MLAAAAAAATATAAAVVVVAPPPRVTNHVADSLHFLGFGTLTLGGRVFPSACKFSEPSLNGAVQASGHSVVFWSAKGFGFIQSEE